MKEINSLQNHLLIATPRSAERTPDPNFDESVTYIYEHNQHGAMGIVINKPTQITLAELLKHLDIPLTIPHVGKQIVLSGGPVGQEQGFILHSGVDLAATTQQSTDKIIVSASREFLQGIADGKEPSRLLVSLGYAGWGAGQLEQELMDNRWLLAPVDTKILFDVPIEKRWRAAAASIGVDLNRLSSDIGHA